MLAAISVQGQRSWFFKLSGPVKDVAKAEADFDAFADSIEFEDGKPVWTLPDGWSNGRSSSSMRFATLTVPGSSPMELSVIPLPTAGEADEYMLANVNRWRGQLSLSSIDAAELATHLKSRDLGDGTTLETMSFSGTSSGSGMSSGAPFAPFAGNRMPRAAQPKRPSGPALPPGMTPTRPDAEPPANSVPFEFAKPASWKTAKNVSLSRLSFSAGSEGESASITVTPLAAAAAALGPNVNRWRGQIGLERASDSEIASEIEELTAHGKTAQYANLVGPNETILGAILVHESQAWFLKLRGANAIAASERENFEAFVESIDFSASQ